MVVVSDKQMRRCPVEGLFDPLNHQQALLGRSIRDHDGIVENSHSGPIYGIVLESQVIQIRQILYRTNDGQVWQRARVGTCVEPCWV